MRYSSWVNPSKDASRPRPLPEVLSGDVGYLAVRLGQISKRGFEKAMAELGLRPPLFDFMTAIAEYGPLSQKDASDIVRMDTAKIVALTDELEAKKVVVRTADPTDRRKNLVSFTKSGQILFSKAMRIAKKTEGELTRKLTTKEQETLRNLLRKTQGL